GLNCALSTAISSNLIYGINLGSPDLTLSYIFYGDDVIITTEWNPGGLNIGSLKSFNLALLQKWLWRWFFFPNALWVKVIKAIHGQEGDFDTYGCKFNAAMENLKGFVVRSTLLKKQGHRVLLFIREESSSILEHLCDV
ncbi:hypothetical protein Tco_0849236, partial [Tanacetum coccineum]